MKVGDLVRYTEPKGTETNIGVVVDICVDTETVEVLWDDGEIWAHDTDGMEIINESR
jgi:hypothetical protein